nr:basic salivary proline-rich protein 1-like isoform X3 [Anas platyrhynchos]
MAYKENVNPGLYGLLKQNGAPAPPCSPAGAPQGPPHHGDPLRCPPAAESRRPASPRASSRTRPCGAQHLGGPPVPAGRSQLRFQKSTGHGAWISSQGREDSAGRGQPTPAGAEAFLSRGHSPHSSPPASSEDAPRAAPETTLPGPCLPPSLEGASKIKTAHTSKKSAEVRHPIATTGSPADLAEECPFTNLQHFYMSLLKSTKM